MINNNNNILSNYHNTYKYNTTNFDKYQPCLTIVNRLLLDFDGANRYVASFNSNGIKLNKPSMSPSDINIHPSKY